MVAPFPSEAMPRILLPLLTLLALLTSGAGGDAPAQLLTVADGDGGVGAGMHGGTGQDDGGGRGRASMQVTNK